MEFQQENKVQARQWLQLDARAPFLAAADAASRMLNDNIGSVEGCILANMQFVRVAFVKGRLAAERGMCLFGPG